MDGRAKKRASKKVAINPAIGLGDYKQGPAGVLVRYKVLNIEEYSATTLGSNTSIKSSNNIAVRTMIGYILLLLPPEAPYTNNLSHRIAFLLTSYISHII